MQGFPFCVDDEEEAVWRLEVLHRPTRVTVLSRELQETLIAELPSFFQQADASLRGKLVDAFRSTYERGRWLATPHHAVAALSVSGTCTLLPVLWHVLQKGFLSRPFHQEEAWMRPLGELLVRLRKSENNAVCQLAAELTASFIKHMPKELCDAFRSSLLKGVRRGERGSALVLSFLNVCNEWMLECLFQCLEEGAEVVWSQYCLSRLATLFVHLPESCERAIHAMLGTSITLKNCNVRVRARAHA